MRFRTLLTILALASLSATALADEYTVNSFQGGYADPGAAPVDTLLVAGQDDQTVAVDLPFTFTYFGRQFSRISVSDNGWLAFGNTTSVASANAALPDAGAPNGVVAPLWDDLKTGTGTVRTFVEGTTPTRTFVIDWSGVDTFAATSTSDLSFQVRLNEGDGGIELAYASGGTWSGLSFTAGIEDPTGTIAYGGPNFAADNSGQPLLDQRFTPTAATVTGVVLRDRPVADATGLGNSTEFGLPVVGAEVVLTRADDGSIAGFAETAADGRFAVTTLGVDTPDLFDVAIFTSGRASRVAPPAGSPYSFTLDTDIAGAPFTDIGTITLDATVDATDAAFRPALNIHQAAHRAFVVAENAAMHATDFVEPVVAAEEIRQLLFVWSEGAAVLGGTSYAPTVGVAPGFVNVSDAPSNPDAYDDDVIVREYGHHVFAEFSVHPGPLTLPRTPTLPVAAEQAWADGFAHWFASVVSGNAVFVDTLTASTADTLDLEMPPATARGTDVTAAVAASLFDLTDAANENEDEFAGTIGLAPSTSADVIATIDRLLDVAPNGGTAHTVRSFFDVWRASGPLADRVATARAFIHHGTLPDDANEPNDRSGEATLSASSALHIPGLSLSPFNDDFFTFTIAGLPQSFVASFAQSTTVELDVDLIDSTDAVLASGSTVGTVDRSALTIVAPGPLPPGDYTIRVTWIAGGTANYSLSFFEPLLLDRGDLPEWTQGVPFKEDVLPLGGVPPFTQSMTTPAPGLFVQENGTRLTGTPSAPGQFDVTVDVTDGAAPANIIAAVIPFTVNPPLSMPPLLGVPIGRDVDVAVGIGGTGAHWTPDPLGRAGLQLIAGDTLQLVGRENAFALFTITATGVDIRGDVLMDGSTQVVMTTALSDVDGRNDIAVPVGGRWGYFFDALEGSQADLTFRFSGTGATPGVRALLDAAGNEIATDGAVSIRGRKLRIRGLTMPATGRFHLILEGLDFSGRLRANSDVRPPRTTRGQAPIDVAGDVATVTFDGLAGSKLKVLLERLLAPTDLRPTVLTLQAPSGAMLALPTPRTRRRGRIAILNGIVLPEDGRYIIRLSGSNGTTGPLFYKLRVRAPRGARLELAE